MQTNGNRRVIKATVSGHIKVTCGHCRTTAGHLTVLVRSRMRCWKNSKAGLVTDFLNGFFSLFQLVQYSKAGPAGQASFHHKLIFSPLWCVYDKNNSNTILQKNEESVRIFRISENKKEGERAANIYKNVCINQQAHSILKYVLYI